MQLLQNDNEGNAGDANKPGQRGGRDEEARGGNDRPSARRRDSRGRDGRDGGLRDDDRRDNRSREGGGRGRDGPGRGQVVGDMRGGSDEFSDSQSMSDEGSSEGDFAEDSGEVSLGSGGDDSLLSETGEDESEFSDDASGSGSADFTDSGSDDGF